MFSREESNDAMTPDGGRRASYSSQYSMKLSEAGVEKGMVLPFQPTIMTFSDVHYFVPCPPVSSSPASPVLLLD